MLFSTSSAEEGRGRAEVHIEGNSSLIVYFDSGGVRYFSEEFHNKTPNDLAQIAEDWANGLHMLNE